MANIEDIAQEFSANLRDKIEGIPAVIGRDNGSGSYTVRVAGRENYVYVRLYGLVSQTVEAKNLRTHYIANLGVRVRKNSDKEYEVLGVDPTIGGIFLGDMLAAANVPVQGELNTVILPNEQFKPLRCRPLDGLVGWIELGVYGDSILGGTTFDLTAAATIASTEKCWAIVSLNPTTNVATVTQGTVVSIVQPLLPEDALTIVYPAGDLRLWAFLVYGTDLTVPGDPARSMSLIPRISTVGSMTSFDLDANTGTAETVADGETMVIAGGDGLATAVAATNTVTVSYDIPSLTEETALDEPNDLFLMYDGGAATYKYIKGENLPGGSGVFTPVGTIWHPKAAPASPNAANDEFADASGGVPTGWTEADYDTTVTVNEQAYGLEITKATANPYSIGGIYKALPAGDFSAWTYVSLLVDSSGPGSGTGMRAGISLFEDATSNTGDIVSFDLYMSNTLPSIQVGSYTAYNTGAANQGLLSTANIVDMPAGVYLRVRRNSTNYYWDISFDGYGFFRFSAYAPSFTPAHIGLTANNQNTGATYKGLFQFYRYTNSDVGSVPIAGRRIKYYA